MYQNDSENAQKSQKVDAFGLKPKRKPWWEEIQRLKQLERESQGLVQRVGDRRSRVYAFVVAYKKLHDGNSPLMRDIQAGCEFKDPMGVVKVLRRLEREGKIKLYKPGPRRVFISIVGGSWDMPGAENIIKSLSV